MKPSLLDVPFPLKGLVVNVAKDKQPPLTAAAAVNVRGYDPVAGRDRGGQRSGMTKYCSQQINGTNAIQDINSVVTTLATPPGSSAGQILVPSATAGRVGDLLSSAGVLLLTGTQTGALHASCWDAAGGYAAYVDPATPTILRLFKFTTAGAVTWTSTPIPATAAVQAIGMATDGTYLYLHVYSSAANYGLPVWKVLCADGSLVGGTFWYKSSDATLTAADLAISNNSLAYGAGELAICYGNSTASGSDAGYCEIINVVTQSRDGSNGLAVGGAGVPVVGVCTDGFGTFYFVGANPTSGQGSLTRIQVAGGGSTLQVTAAALQYAKGICFDPIGVRVVVAYTNGGAYNLATYNIRTLAQITNTTVGVAWRTIQPDGAGGFILYRSNATNNVARIDSTLTLVWGPSSLSTTNTTKGGMSTNTVPVVSASVALSQIRPLVVAGGSVYRFNQTTKTLVGGGLSISAPVIFSTQLQGKMYYADGVNYQVYDSATDVVTTLTASDGTLPRDTYGYGGRLLCTWRQRLVVSGLPLDPTNWFMSAVGDPTNWNYTPSPAVETQAVAGNNSTAGLGADSITALIAYSDEILILGQASSIYQLTGDPASGGRIDLVTDEVGMAYGQPWCRDGQGVIYFLSSRGSVYRFVPGALPERMSDPISELLTGTIDFSTTIARMAWDERQLGFHLFLTKTGGAAAATHYFWDQRNEAWWQDVYANNNHNPLAVHTLQGFTATDRAVLIGGQDGYIRCVDCAAKDDDGTAISSSVTIGPIKDKNAVGLTLIDLQADLDTASDAVSYAIIRGNDAQTALIAPALFSGTFNAGRNRSQAVRAHGHAAYIVLSSNTIAKRWALEYLRIKVLAAEGTDRQRMFIST